jgi:nucleotide-binding universal stress UspA family protein
MLPVKTILHPTDLSEPSEAAYRVACAVARDHGARVVVAHVMTPPLHAYRDFGPLLPDPETVADEVRDSLRLQRPPRYGVPVEYRVCRGDAAGEIVALSEDLKCDLIVMGTHGRAGLKRLVLGSVAEAVLRRAPCPVLTVKAPAPTPVAPERPAKEPAHV